MRDLANAFGADEFGESPSEGGRIEADEFEAERGHLMAVAYRMLGNRSDAEDAVQETWLRYATALAAPQDRDRVRDLRAWLTTTISRICLDVLRSARVRRETYPGQWLPEPVLSPLPGGPAPTTAARAGADGSAPGPGYAPDPAERAVHVERVGMALLTVLERLTPEQRVAFVLHDVFAVPFAGIATTLGTNPAAARQLAARARRAVSDGAARHEPDPVEQRRLLAAFLAAAERGDVHALLAVLAPDVTFIGDGGGVFPSARSPITGRLRVARFLVTLHRRLASDAAGMLVRPVPLGDTLGLRGEGVHAGDRPMRFVMWFTMAAGQITGIYHQRNPEKLTRLPAMTGSAARPPGR